MAKHFWLIQRGSFNVLDTAKRFLGGSSEHLIDPDYMGSSEFEWGAIPMAYRRIMGQYEQFSLHVTDLVTTRGVPFCLYCADSRYKQILCEIKEYLKKPYFTKEWTNMDAHFRTACSLGVDHHKYQLRTNFWWCIDTARNAEDVGDWIAFVGAADRQNAFKRVIESDYKNWWMKKSAAEREQDYKESFR